MSGPQIVTVVVTATPHPSPSPTVTDMPSPSRTPYLTLEPPPTPTPFTLTGRYPSDLDVLRFVFSRHEVPFETGMLQIQLERGEVNDIRFTRHESDLNNDGLPEIVLTGYAGIFDQEMYVAILSYSADGTWHDMYFAADSGHYCAEIYSIINGKRVVVDFFSCSGGTGIFTHTWDQQWVECAKDHCQVVFSARLLDSEDNTNRPASSRYVVTRIEQSSAETIQTITERFQTLDILREFFEFPPDLDLPFSTLYSPRRIVGPDVRETYQWNGQIYSLVKREQLVPGVEITRELSEATDSTKQFVENILKKPFHLRSEDDYRQYREALENFWGIPITNGPEVLLWGSSRDLPEAAASDVKPGNRVAGIISANNGAGCRLTVQRYTAFVFSLIGRKDFYCTPNFTQLSWADVDGDGKDELLVLTVGDFQNQRSYALARRLYVFRADDDLAEIAALVGIINGSDGVGIKWQVDSKGFKVDAGLSFEGFSRDCWWSLSCMNLERRFQTYRWDTANQSFQPEK